MEPNKTFTAEDLKKPLSLAQKTLLSAGGLALLAGIIKPGKIAHGLITAKEVAKRTANANSRIADKYKGIMQASNKQFNEELASVMSRRKTILNPAYKKPNMILHPFKRLEDKIERTVARKGHDVTQVEAKKLLNQVIIDKDRAEEVADAISDIAGRHQEIGETLSSRHLKHLDTILPVIGAASLLGTAMTKKAAQEVKAETKPSIGATKESEMPSKPYPEQTNLLRVPVNYNKGFQCGPIIENADKMSKIAQAVNDLFPKVPTDPRDKIIQKQTKKLDKKDETIAMHEQAHQEKDMKLKELAKAIKLTNKKLEHFRNKAVENYAQSLDLEAETASGTTR